MTYLTFSQLSVKLGGRSRSSLYRDMDRGILPEPLRIGGRVYWREADVDRHIELLQDTAI